MQEEEDDQEQTPREKQDIVNYIPELKCQSVVLDLNNMKQLKDYSIQELKVLAYDLISRNESVAVQLRQVNQEILNKAEQELKEAKKQPEDKQLDKK